MVRKATFEWPARALVAWGMAGGWAGCSIPDGVMIKLVSTGQELEEEELFSDSFWATDKIAIIDVEGVILNTERRRLFGHGDNPVSRLLEELDMARQDDRVKAVVLRINSPGGGVTASDLMREEIERFRKKTKKPVTAVMMDVAASGGYYVACACDEIVAHPTSVTGSIGVIMQLFDATGTMQMIGLKSEAITSGPRKDSGSPFRAMTPEERETFQTMVNELYDRFIEVVVKGRPDLDEGRIRELADGRVYTAWQALEVGLIDRIATLRDTLDELKKRNGDKPVRVVVYKRPAQYRPNYYADAPTQINLLNLQTDPTFWDPAPRFMYLWAPGR